MQKDLRKRQEVWILGVVLAFLLIAFAGAALVLQLYSYNYSKGERTNDLFWLSVCLRIN